MKSRKTISVRFAQTFPRLRFTLGVGEGTATRRLLIKLLQETSKRLDKESSKLPRAPSEWPNFQLFMDVTLYVALNTMSRTLWDSLINQFIFILPIFNQAGPVQEQKGSNMSPVRTKFTRRGRFSTTNQSTNKLTS